MTEIVELQGICKDSCQVVHWYLLHKVGDIIVKGTTKALVIGPSCGAFDPSSMLLAELEWPASIELEVVELLPQMPNQFFLTQNQLDHTFTGCVTP